MDSVEIFRKKLRSIVDEQRGRQSQVADACGIGRNEMNDFLSGRKNFGIDRLERIADYLKISYAEMVRNGTAEAGPLPAAESANESMLKEIILNLTRQNSVLTKMVQDLHSQLSIASETKKGSWEPGSKNRRSGIDRRQAG